MTLPGTQLNNPHDPLKNTDDMARELLTRFGQVAGRDCPISVVRIAAVNMLINTFRQQYSKRRQAEAAWDELVATSKPLLLGHYDSTSGDRRNIFPFTQVINPKMFEGGDK